jgi:outer membrane protein OmpA-like peptidoglycan-associated protein
MGNQATQQFLRNGVLQAKLTVNQPGDPFEQEADSVAETVMRMPDSVARVVRPSSEPPLVQRVCTECEKELQRKRAPGAEAIGSDFQHPHGGGRPLPDSDRRFFEPRFGRDFSKVRIHTGDEATVAARSVNTLAYTVESDVVFGEGQYRPGTEGGRRLLAHELTHVIQQGTASPPSVQRQQPGGPSQAPAGLLCPIATGSPGFVDTDVLFSPGSSTLTPTAIADIASFVARWNAAGTDEFVRVDGYAPDSLVYPVYEPWTLSCDRAMMVEQELMTPSSGGPGIPASFIEIFAQGARAPKPQVTIAADIPSWPPAPLGPGGDCLHCPFFCSYDKSKNLYTYDCSGLAFRTYEDLQLEDAELRLSKGSKVSCGTPCKHAGMIKFWLWEYDSHGQDPSGRVLVRYDRNFHLVGGPTAGGPRLPKDSDAFYSKNGARRVHGPGTALSFKPPTREQETKNEPAETPQFYLGNPVYWARYNFEESCFCFPCPKDSTSLPWLR